MDYLDMISQIWFRSYEEILDNREEEENENKEFKSRRNRMQSVID